MALRELLLSLSAEVMQDDSINSGVSDWYNCVPGAPAVTTTNNHLDGCDLGFYASLTPGPSTLASSCFLLFDRPAGPYRVRYQVPFPVKSIVF